MAIQQAGTDDPLKVAQAMEKGRFSVVSGDIVFDEQHNPKKCAVILEVSPEKVSYKDTVCP
jgi:ABC-type branched-subunit amino acid transport system substrate-binding protein